MKNAERAKIGLEHTLAACEMFNSWAHETHERGETAMFDIMPADENGRGSWAVNIIVLETNNRAGGNGRYSLEFDNDIDVTYTIKDEVELIETVSQMREGARVEWQNLADTED